MFMFGLSFAQEIRWLREYLHSVFRNAVGADGVQIDILSVANISEDTKFKK